MIEIDIELVVVLTLLFTLAGFIDSIAGGGGLISLTSLYLAGLSPVVAVSTNKFSMTFGTVCATINYAKNKKIVWAIALPSMAFALVGSLLGASLALKYASTALRYMLLIVLPLLTLLTLKRKGDGKEMKTEGKIALNSITLVIASVFSFFIGVYDGFFGPGTGTFFTLLFSFLGLPLINSVGTTKIVNLSSNIAAFSTFLVNGTMVIGIGIPCAFASILGNTLGSLYALKKGGKGIKRILVGVIGLLYLKIVLDFFIG